MEPYVTRVTYYEGIYGYDVYRCFTSREKAQEFIDVNAMIYPLPRLRVENLVNGEWVKES